MIVKKHVSFHIYIGLFFIGLQVSFHTHIRALYVHTQLHLPVCWNKVEMFYIDIYYVCMSKETYI